MFFETFMKIETITENIKLIIVTINKNSGMSLLVSFCGKEKLCTKFNGLSNAKFVSFNVLN